MLPRAVRRTVQRLPSCGHRSFSSENTKDADEDADDKTPADTIAEENLASAGSLRARHVWAKDKTAKEPKHLWISPGKQMCAGGLMSLTGIWALAFANQETILEYATMEAALTTLGGSMMVGGVIMTVPAILKAQQNKGKAEKDSEHDDTSEPVRSRRRESDDSGGLLQRLMGGGGSASKGPTPQFEFKRLNDDVHFETDCEELATLIAEPVWPDDIKEEFERLAKEEKTKMAERKEMRATQLKLMVHNGIMEGRTLKQVRQRLTPRVFVIDYDDFTPPQAGKPRRPRPLPAFTRIVTFLCAQATKHDEVVIRLSSPGGSVIEYGLASSQLHRLKSAGIPTTVCVDQVAASGGYMMACIADKIVSAPFAMLGSIGVVAEMPNVAKVLKKNDVDWLQFTAGKYKRTVGTFTDVTDDARAKFQEDLEAVHVAFKDHVWGHRGQLDIDAVATGETWLGVQSQEHNLVDEISTSDEYLRGRMKDCDVILVTLAQKREASPLQRLMGEGVSAVHRVCDTVTHFVHQKSTSAGDLSIPQVVTQDPKVGARF